MATAPSATVQVAGQNNGFFSDVIGNTERAITDATSAAGDLAINALVAVGYNVGEGKLSPSQLTDIANANAQSVARAGGNAMDQQLAYQQTFQAANQVAPRGPVDAIAKAANDFKFPAVFSLSSLFGSGDGGSADGSSLDWKTVAQVVSVAAAAVFLIKALK